MVKTTACIAAVLVMGLLASNTSAAGPVPADQWWRGCSAFIEALRGAEGGDNDMVVAHCIGQSVGILDGLRTGSQLGAVSIASQLTVLLDLDSEQVFALLKRQNATDLLRVCLPDDNKIGAHIQTVYRYIEQHPELRSRPVAAVFFEALQAQHPCTED